MRISAAHDVNPHGRLAIDSVVHALQRMVEPAQLEGHEVEGRVVCELRFTREADAGRLMNPGTRDEPLQALLASAQLDEIQVRDRRPQESYQPVM